ncbi:uncharacterized protein LOC127801047 isoform X1 [Diospyros lotus]|uniref:uncharacterized protein LOC127801047 isoform X1 n=1 Tax=Diospyros lotus TaxID=55363 RepID=UPI0022588383|nr:uncharacterized protein LOC127801047 isoform X1 [Diospyros lotus]
MARAPTKHGRDQALDFQGFLNDLQDWEMSLNDKDKKQKMRGLDKRDMVSSPQNIGLVGEDRRPMTNAPASHSSSTVRQYHYSTKYDTIRNLSSGFMPEESSLDAASEKELGNEYFKQKKFQEAIECYSRSIALSPTAVAYANRAMAYLKIKRFQEAEDDCTEALNLDDRYIKAYSRRSTARKELGKLEESIEDAEFALRLEPHNQEIKKQYAEVKSLYDKEMLKQASESLRSSVQELPTVRKPKVEVNGQLGCASNSSEKMRAAAIQENSNKDSDCQQVPTKAPTSVLEMESKRSRLREQEGNLEKQELKASVQELAARAASFAKVEAAKNITPPNSAYEFELSWRGLAGDRTLQARLLKVTSPVALPQIFKNALSAPMLIDIIKCIATFFNEEMDLAVKYLQNLVKISRFDTIIMCLASTDGADLQKIWDDVFCGNSTPMEYVERLDKLRPRYCRKR